MVTALAEIERAKAALSDERQKSKKPVGWLYIVVFFTPLSLMLINHTLALMMIFVCQKLSHWYSSGQETCGDENLSCHHATLCMILMLHSRRYLNKGRYIIQFCDVLYFSIDSYDRLFHFFLIIHLATLFIFICSWCFLWSITITLCCLSIKFLMYQSASLFLECAW